jgi:hypothetical protein
VQCCVSEDADEGILAVLMVDVEVLVVSSLVVFDEQVVVAALVNGEALAAVHHGEDLVELGGLRVEEQFVVGDIGVDGVVVFVALSAAVLVFAV